MSEGKLPQFMQVGEFVAGFGGNELPHCEDLQGRTCTVHCADGRIVTASFHADQELTWRETGRSPAHGDGLERVERYRASCIRPDYYLVDFVPQARPTESVTLVLDFAQEIATAVLAGLPTREEAAKPLFQRVIDKELLSPVACEIVHGAIDRPFTSATAQHRPATDLLGKRVRYQYGPSDAYEHIYLSANLYTWHCLEGPERGLADTDFCRCHKLADELYLFVWLEKVIPTVGVILIDFQRAKTSGKIFGYQGDDFGRTCNTAVGAVLSLQNVTSYGDDARG